MDSLTAGVEIMAAGDVITRSAKNKLFRNIQKQEERINRSATVINSMARSILARQIVEDKQYERNTRENEKFDSMDMEAEDELSRLSRIKQKKGVCACRSCKARSKKNI